MDIPLLVVDDVDRFTEFLELIDERLCRIDQPVYAEYKYSFSRDAYTCGAAARTYASGIWQYTPTMVDVVLLRGLWRCAEGERLLLERSEGTMFFRIEWVIDVARLPTAYKELRYNRVAAKPLSRAVLLSLLKEEAVLSGECFVFLAPRTPCTCNVKH
jgi:hypothetical protein